MVHPKYTLRKAGKNWRLEKWILSDDSNLGYRHGRKYSANIKRLEVSLLKEWEFIDNPTFIMLS